MSFAGVPPTRQLGSTSFATTAPAAIVHPGPIVTPGRILTPIPSQQSYKLVSKLDSSNVVPKTNGQEPLTMEEPGVGKTKRRTHIPNRDGLCK